MPSLREKEIDPDYSSNYSPKPSSPLQTVRLERPFEYR